QELMFPYLSGANFLMKLTYSDEKLRDDAFRSFPLSTEQIIHPEKYTVSDRDDPVSFSLPNLSARIGNAWKLSFTNVMGELQIRLLFENWREWDEARIASEGWGGDQYAVYRNGDKYLFLWMTLWDTEDDADEFFRDLSDLMRTKIYRREFAGADFS